MVTDLASLLRQRHREVDNWAKWGEQKIDLQGLALGSRPMINLKLILSLVFILAMSQSLVLVDVFRGGN